MTNATIEKLKILASEAGRDKLSCDPEYTRAKETWDSRQHGLKQRCAGDKELYRLFGDALDAYAAVACIEKEFQLLLGLQIGLELGAIDLLGEEFI